MVDFVPSEKGVTIRQPSTANLLIDSVDRYRKDASGNLLPLNLQPLVNSFIINKPQSILNGFFTRIGTTEVVLEWNTANIGGLFNNESLTIDLSGSTSGTASPTVLAPTGFYTQAQLINWAILQLNNLSASTTPSPTWSVSATTTGQYALVPSANVYVRFSGPLAVLLGWNASVLVQYGPTAPAKGFIIPAADLRPYRFIDFVSNQLTYNQDLKDSSTGPTDRDVLCRWYFDFDQPPDLDQYGFPILMGYTSFYLRRTFSPAKQIKWSANQPIGQLGFEVYGNDNALANMNFQTQWLMTLQISEV